MNSPKKIERLPDPVPGEVVPLKEMVWKTNEIIDVVNEMKLEMDIAEKAYAKLHHKIYTSEGDAVGEVEKKPHCPHDFRYNMTNGNKEIYLCKYCGLRSEENKLAFYDRDGNAIGEMYEQKD